MRLSLHVFLGYAIILVAVLVAAAFMSVPPSVLLMLALVGLLASLAGTALVLRLFTRPVHELAIGAQQIAAGDFKPIALADAPADFQTLANSFNQMVESLHSRDEQLQSLNDRLSRHLRELQALYEVSRSVNSSLDGQEVLRTILNETVKTFPTAKKGLIHLVDESGKRLIPVALSDTPHRVDHSMGMSIDRGIAGQVVRERRPITLGDTSKDPNFVDLGSGVRSLMVTPLEIGNSVIGALSLDSDQRNAFTPDMEVAFRSLANSAATALENARLYGDSQRRVEELIQLYQATLELSGEQSIDSLHQRLVQSAVALLGAAGGTLFLSDGEQKVLTPAYVSNMPATQSGLRSYRFGEGLVGQVAQSGESDLLDTGRMMALGAEQEAEQAGHVIAAPIIWESKVLGVVQVFRDPAKSRFEPTHLRLLTLFAQQAASAMENARLLASQRRRSRQLALLNNLNRRFAAILDADALIQEAIRGVEETFGYSAVMVGLVEQDWITLRGSADLKARGIYDTPLRVGQQGIIGHVAASGQPHLANDVASDPYYLPVVAEVQSELAVPILGKDGVLGVLDVQERRRNAFLYNDVTLLQSLAVQLGIALDNARLFRAAQGRAEQLNKILEVTEEVRQQQVLERVLQKIVEVVQQTLGWHTVALVLWDNEGMSVPVAVASDDEALCEQIMGIPPRPVGNEAWKDERYRISQSYFIPVERASSEFEAGTRFVTTVPVEQLKPWEWQPDDALIIPIVGHSGILGHLSVDAPANRRRPGLEQIQVLEIFAHQAASAIEDARRIEELRTQTSALELANQDLSRASKLKSEFLANMSHELRTPLNAILGFSEILIDQAFGPLNERQTKYISNINTSGQHLLDLINDILDLSKIEAGRMELMLEPFRLTGALHEIYTVIESLATKKQLSITIDASAGPERVVADRLRFKQVLYNIVANAVKFTPEGGSIAIRAWEELPANDDDPRMLHIEIKDTGIGIPEDQLTQIFDVFHRLDRSYRRETEGTGLGLALVRRFVELHGGDVRAESTVGVGSTFTISLPQTDSLPTALESIEAWGEG